MSYKCPNCDRTSEQPETCPTCNVPMIEVVAEAPATESVQPTETVSVQPEAASEAAPAESPTPEA